MTEILIRPGDTSWVSTRWNQVLGRLQDDCPPWDPADVPWLPLTRVGVRPASLVEARDEVAALQSQCARSVGQRVLDLGCGVGRHLVWFLHDGLEVVGIDDSPGLCRLATHLTEGAADIRCGDLVDDIPSGTFDLITLLSETFGIGTDPARDAKLLARAGRSLAPDGYLVLQLADADCRVAAGARRHEWSSKDDGYRAVEWIATERFVSTRRFALTFDHSTETYELVQRLYSAKALRDLAAAAGLVLSSFERVGAGFRADADGEDVLAILRPRP